MKISPKIVHIPPYISTSWENIRALFLKEKILVIHLKEGPEINIPDLEKEAIDAIFGAHAEFLEEQNREQGHQKDRGVPARLFQPSTLSSFNAPYSAEPVQTASFQFAFSTIDSLNSAMHHNPAQSNMPALPEEILSKISAIAKIVAPEEIQNMPIPESNCNCMHCQIARAIHRQLEGNQPNSKSIAQSQLEEPISEEDLTFQDWEITSGGDKLYNVVSKLHPQEKYLVYLGEPFGCTCGMSNCEHIVAVLRS